MKLRRWAVIFVATVLATGVAAATASAGQPVRGGRGARHARPFRALTQDEDRRIDVNNINMFVTNIGALAYDLAGNYNGGLFWPNHTSKTAVYAAGLWCGAMVHDSLRLAVAEYDQEYRPGRLFGTTSADDPGDPRLRVYKVHAWSGNPSDTAHVDNPSADATVGEDPLVHDSWSDYVANAKPFGAPTRNYTFHRASLPDTVVEGPDVIGDQMLWCVYNDGQASAHENEAGSTPPLFIQVTQTAFAFDRLGPLGNVVFVKYRIKNCNPDTLKQFFVSQWADPDLGNASDDLAGCDTLPDFYGQRRSMGFVYNGSNHDDIYGTPPPALGVDFLKGPVDAAGDTLGLTSFAKYINGTDPLASVTTYNWMTGHMSDADGNPLDIVDPWGHVTHYMNAGDPLQHAYLGSNDQLDWVDSNPADRRFFLSSGPIDFAPGAEQEVVVAFCMGECQSNLESIKHLDYIDDAAQQAFNLGFVVPTPPPAPAVTATIDHDRITLAWDTAAQTASIPAGYQFEGYNVYQGETVAGPWQLVAAYDSSDAITTVYDRVFDFNTCTVIPEGAVARGTNIGVRHVHDAPYDFVRGTSIKDGTDYYYAVTSYIVDPAAPADRVLESSQKPVTVRPQRTTASLGTKPDRVLPVPNPYYAHSAYELNQFARRIRFMNCPTQCKLRIYNLAGQLVRTLDKQDASTSVMEWDLLTDNQLPVASGVYVYVAESPGGQKVGRVVVFMEKERLNNY